MNPQYHPAPLAPLSSQNAYTSWPGGVDPTVSQFRTEQMGGKTRRNARKARKATRKNRKDRKNTRRNRK
jgi:hypothetical protein